MSRVATKATSPRRGPARSSALPSCAWLQSAPSLGTQTASPVGPRRGEIAFVATRDIARGEAITLDYCPFSATTAHREAVLRPFLLEHLARVPVVEDAPVAYPDEVAPLRRREPDFAPHP